MNPFHRIYMPELVCGRGSISFVTTLGKKRAAVLGYADDVKQVAQEIFRDTDTEILYVATIDREPCIGDLFRYVEKVQAFEPDLILAIGGGGVMDVAKGLHLFYENPELSFDDCLRPFTLPSLGKKAEAVFVPTTSGTGSEVSSAAVFVDEKAHVKKLLLSNTLIPRYAVLDPAFTDSLPASVQMVTGLDALSHAIESSTAKNANAYTKAIAMEAAVDILEYLPVAVDQSASDEQRQEAREKLQIAATLAGVAITNSFTGIVHSYDHPGPAFNLPHGLVCGIMLPHSMELIGPHESYACVARRLGYSGNTTSLSTALGQHIRQMIRALGLPDTFADTGIDEAAYLAEIPRWAELSLQGMATKMSPANMDLAKGELFYKLCYYGKI